VVCLCHVMRMYLHNFTVVWPCLFSNDVYFDRSCCNEIICNQLFVGWRHARRVISDSSSASLSSIRCGVERVLLFLRCNGSYARNELHGKEIMHGGRYCHARMAFIPRFAYCVAFCAFSNTHLTFSFCDSEVYCTSKTLALSNYCSMIGGEILLNNTAEFLNSSTISHTDSRFT